VATPQTRTDREEIVAKSQLEIIRILAGEGLEAQLHQLHAVNGDPDEHELTRAQARRARSALILARVEIRKVDEIRDACDGALARIQSQADETQAKIRELLEGETASIEGTVETLCPQCKGGKETLIDGTLEVEPCFRCAGRGTLPPEVTS
jgi:hypothetical protein